MAIAIADGCIHALALSERSKRNHAELPDYIRTYYYTTQSDSRLEELCNFGGKTFEGVCQVVARFFDDFTTMNSVKRTTILHE